MHILLAITVITTLTSYFLDYYLTIIFLRHSPELIQLISLQLLKADFLINPLGSQVQKMKMFSVVAY